MSYQFYPTPYPIISDLLDLHFIQDGDMVLEPCAGKGDIVKRVKECYPETNLTAVEIAKEFEKDLLKCDIEYVHIGDFLKMDLGQKFDKIVCNPPFTFAEEFVERCYNHLMPEGRMAFLLRLSMLSGKKRYHFFKKFKPSYVYIVNQRMPFNGNMVDACGYAWVIWESDCVINPPQDTIVRWISP